MDSAFDPTAARSLFNIIAQVVPVFVLAAVAAPWAVRTPQHRRGALADLAILAIMLGAALLTETLALMGLYLRPGPTDLKVTCLCFAVTCLLATARILLAPIRAYAQAAAIPPHRVWAPFALLALLAAFTLLFTAY